MEIKLLEPGFTLPMWDHGFVRYIDHHGSDQRIVEAARISYRSPSKGDEADQALINYLYRNRHTSPFEQCNITFNIKMPIFCMRQFVRHRTFRLNEVSARYTELPNEFYIPRNWKYQDKKNKQGSAESLPHETNQDVSEIVSNHLKNTYELYEMLLKMGISKEQARFVLPVNIYTEIYVNIDLHNLIHFLRLRTDGHAQGEIQTIAYHMKNIAATLFPWTFKAVDRYKVKIIDLENPEA